MNYEDAKRIVFEEMERWLPLNYPMDGKGRKLFWRAKNTSQQPNPGIWDVYRDVPVVCAPNTFDCIVREIENDTNFGGWWVEPYGQFTVTKMIYEEKGFHNWFAPQGLNRGEGAGVVTLLGVYPVDR